MPRTRTTAKKAIAGKASAAKKKKGSTKKKTNSSNGSHLDGSASDALQSTAAINVRAPCQRRRVRGRRGAHAPPRSPARRHEPAAATNDRDRPRRRDPLRSSRRS
uniref:Uncharacterized protein n=1 Tax=Neobodo designis TaxID=312471 RepID=A0A7S1Q706_NEODS|mmetsp:Transcript_34903/g.107747  ORF Transcript_34903/g.107747 Transcript_34903/m.107747 type:complete len:105 (+) Transcript_34903:75-389(+)